MAKGLYALVGMKHRGTEAFVASLPQGEPLVLIREPDNRHDRNAIQVWARDRHVAYVKATQARPLAMAMDSAPRPEFGLAPTKQAKLAVDGGRWPMVEVET